MSWRERMKRAVETFKRMAVSLYIWSFLFAGVGFIIAIIAMVPLFLVLWQGDFRVFVPDLRGFSGNFPNPAQPVPPANPFAFGTQGPHSYSQWLALVPNFLMSLFLFAGLGCLAYSLFTTGVFHLTKKAYGSPQAQFKDFRAIGFFRVLSWQALLWLLFGVAVLGGVLIAYSFRQISYAGSLLAFAYFLVLASLGIFLAPWLFTAVYSLLNHKELALSLALRKSWDLYWRNKMSFWSYLVTAILIQGLTFSINEESPGFGLLLSLLTTPFLMILPIVWVLTHEEEAAQGDGPVSTTPTPVTGEPLPPSVLEDEPLSPSVREEPSPDTLLATPSATQICPRNTAATDRSAMDTSAIDTPGNFCPTCGRSVGTGANYCSQCGTKLEP